MTGVIVNLEMSVENSIILKFVMKRNARKENKCKVLSKNICAFSNAAKVQKDDKIDKFEKEINALKHEIESLKAANKVLEDKVNEYFLKHLKITHFQTNASKSVTKDAIDDTIVFKCSLCSETFDSEAKLKLHIQRNHSPVNNSYNNWCYIIKINKKKVVHETFDCDKCGYTFKSRTSL